MTTTSEYAQRVLDSLGVDKKLKGYGYIVDAVVLICTEPEKYTDLKNTLYPKIATVRNTCPANVERNIRNAIYLAFRCGNFSAAEFMTIHKFADNGFKATNSRFIFAVAENVAKELKKVQINDMNTETSGITERHNRYKVKRNEKRLLIRRCNGEKED